MAKFRFIDDMLKGEQDTCAVKGCNEPGEYRAPVKPDADRQFQYFCLEHIKQFNKAWDYFRGKSQEEIEQFQRNIHTGHRPTWRRDGRQPTTAEMEAAFARFMNSETVFRPAAPPISQKLVDALTMLELEHPVTMVEIKREYKRLVKQYHPDRNPGDKKAEEKFKWLTNAYHYLNEHYEKSISNL